MSKHKQRYTPVGRVIKYLGVLIRALATLQAKFIMLEGKQNRERM